MSGRLNWDKANRENRARQHGTEPVSAEFVDLEYQGRQGGRRTWLPEPAPSPSSGPAESAGPRPKPKPVWRAVGLTEAEVHAATEERDRPRRHLQFTALIRRAKYCTGGHGSREHNEQRYAALIELRRLEAAGPPWTPEEIDELRDLVEEGLSYNDIATLLKRTKNEVCIRVTRPDRMPE